QQSWHDAGFYDTTWRTVTMLAPPTDRLDAPEQHPVRAIKEITHAKVFKKPVGDTVLDMGQNMVGWIRFRVSAPAGTTMTLRHAEVLDKAGNFYTANLRWAEQTIRYTTDRKSTRLNSSH